MSERTQQQDEEYREAFKWYDKDGSGYIEPNELPTVLRALGENPTKARIRDFLTDLGKHPGDKISYEEFATIMDELSQEEKDDEQLFRAFKVFDKDGNGSISADELRQVMTELGEALTEEEADDMMKEADQDENGRIDIREFCNLMNKKF